MPIISVFFGIIIRMHYLDHNPPHLHAEYQGFDAFFDIKTGRLLGGHFPKSAQAILRTWILKHKKELFRNWEKARRHEPLIKIEGADES
jgi:hypothetical protein